MLSEASTSSSLAVTSARYARSRSGVMDAVSLYSRFEKRPARCSVTSGKSQCPLGFGA